MKLRLAVVYGSRACEHDVSIISALQAAQNADRNEYDVLYVYIDKNGEWYTGERLADIAFYRNFDPRAVVRVLPMGANGKLRLMQHPDDKLFPIGRLRQIAEADVVMPVMHGMNGEDGTLQGMLDRGFDEKKILVVNTLDEAAKNIPVFAQNGDAVLFENDLPDNYTVK